MVNSDQVAWVPVRSVDKVENEPVTFDVTVPGPHLTACPVSGIVVHQTMQFHVPTSEAAVKEAYERMLPSKNLISPADFKTPVHSLGQEYLLGAFLASQENKRRPRVFRNKRDALEALARGEMSYSDPVEIIDHGDGHDK